VGSNRKGGRCGALSLFLFLTSRRAKDIGLLRNRRDAEAQRIYEDVKSRNRRGLFVIFFGAIAGVYEDAIYELAELLVGVVVVEGDDAVFGKLEADEGVGEPGEKGGAGLEVKGAILDFAVGLADGAA
jgi:hypothetical protein